MNPDVCSYLILLVVAFILSKVFQTKQHRNSEVGLIRESTFLEQISSQLRDAPFYRQADEAGTNYNFVHCTVGVRKEYFNEEINRNYCLPLHARNSTQKSSNYSQTFG